MDHNDLSSYAPCAGYHSIEKSVTGGNRTTDREMDSYLKDFLDSGAFGLLHRGADGECVLHATAKDITGIRGTGSKQRLDIQGAEGKDKARIAYQIGKHVIAQVVIPLNKRIKEEDLKAAFHTSSKTQKVVVFDTMESIAANSRAVGTRSASSIAASSGRRGRKRRVE